MDTNNQEVIEFFSKVGLIQEDPQDGSPLINLYVDESTEPPKLKGDCSLCYVQASSVEVYKSYLHAVVFSFCCCIVSAENP